MKLAVVAPSSPFVSLELRLWEDNQRSLIGELSEGLTLFDHLRNMCYFLHTLLTNPVDYLACITKTLLKKKSYA
jgi:hypothetical protein